MSGPRKPGSDAAEAVAAISLEAPLRTLSNDQPESLCAGRATLLLGLSPGGVCHARAVSCPAVSSYLAISPLPSPVTWQAGGVFSVALSLAFRPVGVTHHPAQGSPDFPPASQSSPAAARGPDPRQHSVSPRGIEAMPLGEAFSNSLRALPRAPPAVLAVLANGFEAVLSWPARVWIHLAFARPTSEITSGFATVRIPCSPR